MHNQRAQALTVSHQNLCIQYRGHFLVARRSQNRSETAALYPYRRQNFHPSSRDELHLVYNVMFTFGKRKKDLLVAIINSADNLTEELLRNTLGEFSCVGNEI